MTLWANRMGAAPADALMAFTASLAFDKRLAASDVKGSIAHVHGLLRAGILTAGEADSLVDALGQVGAELASDSFEYLETDEDVHTAIERRVTELAPESGTKLHTGRSRNDQVATALRLFTREELARVIGHVLELPTDPRATSHGGRGRLPARLHPPAARAASAAWRTTCLLTAGRWLATSTGCSRPGDGSTCRLSVPARSLGRRSGSILTWLPTSWGSRAVSRTRSTP